MKKIPHGSSHHGSGFTSSSPGYSFGDVHDSHPPFSAPSYPDFKPIGPPSHYHSHKPSYPKLIKGIFSASSSPFINPGHSSAPVSHIYHGASPPHSFHGPPSHSSVELDYDPTISGHSTGAKFPFSSGPGFGPSSSHETHSVSSDYSPPTGNAHLNPPSTNYGYPVGNVEAQNHSPNLGHSDIQHHSQNVHQLVEDYNNQPANLPHVPQVPPAQIHITPTTNFIEYTNIQHADSQQLHHPQQQAQDHQFSQAQSSATSQQMAEEVIKYLGNLQQGANGGGNQNGNPQLFFGLNVPLGGDNGGGEVQDDSFPLYPPGTSPQNSAGSHIFMPTPLPPDGGANSYAPSGGEYSGEQISPQYSHNANAQYPVDSYGHPVQGSKSLHKNHNNHNYNPNGHVKFLKPQSSLPSHHPNGVSTQARHKTKPEFDIVRSVSFELGAAGPVIHR